MLTSESLVNLSSNKEQFLAKNQESLKQLVTFFRLVNRFCFAVIEVNSDNDLDTILNEITNHKQCTNIQFLILTLDNPELRFLHDELVKRLAEFTIESDKKFIIILRGLENPIGWENQPSPFLADLNWIRDLYPIDIPYPIVFCLPTYAVNKLAKLAPDMWAWITPVITFNSIEIKPIQQDNLTLNNQTQISQFEEKIPKDIEERIDFLTQRLAEYYKSNLRSPLAPLKKGGSGVKLPLTNGENHLQVPLAKEDLRGSHSSQTTSTDHSIKELFYLLSELGIAYRQQKDLEKAENYLLQAEDLLQEKDLLKLTIEQANLYFNLGWLYADKIKGSKPDNLEKAINYYQLALKIYTREAFPNQWAMIQNNLAIAYLYRIKGDRGDNLEKAIQCYENALQERQREVVHLYWATTQNNLANAYLYRIKGDRGDNLEKAIQCYKNVLQEWQRQIVPLIWATTQNNLANAYINRIKGDRGDNLEIAIFCYENALQERQREIVPLQWAATQNNLGNAYLYRIKGDRGDNLEKAIQCYENALLERQREVVPLDWAATQNNLAIAYSNLGEDERAIDYYEKALEIRREKGDTYAIANTLYGMGFSYARLSRNGEALKAFQSARDLYADMGIESEVKDCEEAIKNLE